MGHALKLLSYYYVYIVFVRTSLQQPFYELAKLNYMLDNNKKSLEEIVEELRLECEERKRVESENRIKEEMLEAIMEASISGKLITNSDEKIIHVNKLFQDMWKISPDRILGKNIQALVDIIGNEIENACQFEDFLYLISQGKNFYNKDLYFKDGTIIDAFSLPFTKEGQYKGKVLSFRDVTDKKKIEELKRQIEIKQVFLEQAREFDELKTSFFATVSHELRTPINIILGTIQLLPYLKENINSEIEGTYIPSKYIIMMRQNCYRLIKLANNLSV